MITRPGEALARATRHSPPSREPSRGKIDAELVVYRLEEAGTTLLSLPSTFWGNHVTPETRDAIRTALDAYGWTGPRNPPPVPDKLRTQRMAEAFAWLDLTPDARPTTRKIVMLRALKAPVTKNYLFTFPALGKGFCTTPTGAKNMHTEGVRLIVEALRNG